MFPDINMKTIRCLSLDKKYRNGNWASEASPTLGCSIEISRDICICYSTGWSDIRDIFHEL